MKDTRQLIPLLVVQGAAAAIEFYVRALGAQVLTRFEHGASRHVSHADLRLGSAMFCITEEARAWNSDAPLSLGGSPVVLQLALADADGALAAMCDAGATVVFPMQELLGERMARVRDPFGHLWILRQRLEELTVDEIQRRRTERFELVSRQAAAAGAQNIPTLEASPPGTQAPNDASTCLELGQARRRARVHLVIGPVGAGKSTFALRLAREHAALRLTLDQWMVQLFSPDRLEAGVMDWYVERAARCVERIWSVAQGVTDLGNDVVLEIGLLQRRERERFYQRVQDAGLELMLHVLDATRDVRRARVNERNRAQGATFSMVVPPAIFELASDLWEPPDESECLGREVVFLRTDGA
ncbi:MAG: AAA family ATPase [Deltaproteobacteria bacterium]